MHLLRNDLATTSIRPSRALDCMSPFYLFDLFRYIITRRIVRTCATVTKTTTSRVACCPAHPACHADTRKHYTVSILFHTSLFFQYIKILNNQKPLYSLVTIALEFILNPPLWCIFYLISIFNTTDICSIEC